MPRGTLRTMTALVRRQLKMLKLEASETASRMRRFVASDETPDSYNSIVRVDGWQLDRFEKNPVVLFGHASWAHPIGKGRAVIEDKKLILEATFFDEAVNPLSERTLRILDEGVMGASVGFQPIEWEIDEERMTGNEEWWEVPINYTRQSLLEVSVVTLPSNENALPEGRAQMRSLITERLDARRRAKAPAMSTEEVTKVVERVVRETRAEQHAAELRRLGKTSRS
jgi:hypothetical protein